MTMMVAVDAKEMHTQHIYSKRDDDDAQIKLLMGRAH